MDTTRDSCLIYVVCFDFVDNGFWTTRNEIDLVKVIWITASLTNLLISIFRDYFSGQRGSLLRILMVIIVNAHTDQLRSDFWANLGQKFWLGSLSVVVLSIKNHNYKVKVFSSNTSNEIRIPEELDGIRAARDLSREINFHYAMSVAFLNWCGVPVPDEFPKNILTLYGIIPISRDVGRPFMMVIIDQLFNKTTREKGPSVLLKRQREALIQLICTF